MLIADTRAKGEEVKTKLTEMGSNEYKQKRADDNGLTAIFTKVNKELYFVTWDIWLNSTLPPLTFQLSLFSVK